MSTDDNPTTINNQPLAMAAAPPDYQAARDNMRLERIVTDMRVEVAGGLAAINTRLDVIKDHEPRLRELEKASVNQITRSDVGGMLKDAIDAARRPAWRDVGMLVAAIATSVGLVLAVLQASGVGG